MQKILVALDRSPQAPFVFAHALKLVQREESSLMILHALEWEHESGLYGHSIATLADVDAYGTFQHLAQQRLQEEIDKARDWLWTYYQQASAQGITTEYDCMLGKPNQRICDVARSWNADLSGRRGLSEIFLGSVSNSVLHHASCSVLIVQGMASPATTAAATQVEMSR